MALLEVNDLRTSFRTDDGVVKAVDGVSFSVEKGKTLGIVGESGCGKSVTMLTVMGLNNRRLATSTGQALFKGDDLLTMRPNRLRELRGDEIAMIFQDPMTSLNPVHSVGKQLVEAVLLHNDVTKKEARERALQALVEVGIPRAERRIDDYPHQFSGGMRQRVMIAIALACNPKLLIADEPTTALDVTIQAQILDLLAELKSELGMAVMLITHAMGVVAEVAQRVVVMYAGKVVEEAPVGELFAHPRHPYTQGLIRSIPRIDTAATQKVRLESIPGTVPKLIEPAEGCRFAPRCKARVEHNLGICTDVMPQLLPVGTEHNVRCWLYHSDPAHGHTAPLGAEVAADAEPAARRA